MVLLGLMIVIGLLVIRQHAGIVKMLPTMSRIDAETANLESMATDLQVMQKQNREWNAEFAALQDLAQPFWVFGTQRALIEQEVTKEFGKILRTAQVVPQKVESQRNKLPSFNHVVEVEIRLDLRGVSMQEVSRLFQEVEKSRRKLIWSYCKIEPDNPRTPTSVNVSARLKAFALSQESADFLLGENTELPARVAGKGKTL
jgi:hypothetical protein